MLQIRHSVCSEQDVGHLFSNLELVLQANTSIVEELLALRVRTSDADDMKIGSIFGSRVRAATPRAVRAK